MEKDFATQNRDFKGIWIPKEIWLDEDLTCLEKVILVEIDSLDNGDAKGCYASNEYLASFCQCSINKVSSAIQKLISLGYVRVLGTDGRHRFLRSTMKVAQVAAHVTQDFTDNMNKKYGQVKF